MRDIKFRAWDGSLMLFFSLDSLRDNFGDDCCMTPKGEDAPPHSGLNWPVMQFTGLQDSKGVDIYEGDIVQWITTHNNTNKDKHIDVMKWDEEGACFMLMPWIHEPYAADMTVIGNIHENPELLE